jgi:hypothetical protein
MAKAEKYQFSKHAEQEIVRCAIPARLGGCREESDESSTTTKVATWSASRSWEASKRMGDPMSVEYAIAR